VSMLRDELTRKVAGRLELTEARLGTLLNGGGPGPPSPPASQSVERQPSPAPGPRLDQGLRSERDFLALCLALPAEGEAMLVEIDPDELLSSEALRRAARHLRGRVAAPLSELPADDEALARTVADLVALAGRGREPNPARLRHARLVLERARLDRAIARTRAQGGAGISELAHAREEVLEQIHTVVSELQ
jgi:hypothetical protein